MSTEKAAKKRPGNVMPAAKYAAMVAEMKQLAMRNSVTEALVLRIAKRGDVAEVVEYIGMMRVYQKKHVRVAGPRATAAPRPVLVRKRKQS